MSSLLPFNAYTPAYSPGVGGDPRTITLPTVFPDPRAGPSRAGDPRDALAGAGPPALGPATSDVPNSKISLNIVLPPAAPGDYDAFVAGSLVFAINVLTPFSDEIPGGPFDPQLMGEENVERRPDFARIFPGSVGVHRGNKETVSRGVQFITLPRLNRVLREKARLAETVGAWARAVRFVGVCLSITPGLGTRMMSVTHVGPDFNESITPNIWGVDIEPLDRLFLYWTRVDAGGYSVPQLRPFASTAEVGVPLDKLVYYEPSQGGLDTLARATSDDAKRSVASHPKFLAPILVGRVVNPPHIVTGRSAADVERALVEDSAEAARRVGAIAIHVDCVQR